jgi:uncharacterized membrane protein YraQ (UPF0718 family)/YHS domain-containing protein
VHEIDKVLAGLTEGWWMFFDTFWALVFGFILSGVVQALVTRKKMQSLLGDHAPSTIARASFFGIVSSSCSYAASALAHSIYKKGADFTASMVFMFASTNLVIELGIVLWFLIGWQFALAEFVGGAVMILLLSLLLPRFFSETREVSPSTQKTLNLELIDLDSSSRTSLFAKLRASAGFTMGDFRMLRWELIIGFVVAGLAMKVVPFSFWKALFLSGHGFWSTLENVIVGPVLAFISFVCSVGNVPLAAALWNAGITFGGVIAFIFADLISLPLVLIYRKYYGTKMALKLTLIFWLVMSVSGLITEGIFSALKAIPMHMSMSMGDKHFGLNATTILDAVALILAALVYYFYKQPDSSGDNDFAQDPICGMQVRKSDAPASWLYDGVTYYFCMQGCKDAYMNQVAKETTDSGK